MHEIICPHCSKAFKIDEAGYADILKQVRDGAFEQALHERLELAEREKRDAIALAKAEVTNALQKAAAAKDTEIQALKAQLDAGEVARKLAVAEALGTVSKERDALANELKNELERARNAQQAAAQLAEAKLATALAPSYAIDNALDASFLFAVGITDRLELSAVAPITLFQDGDGLSGVLGTTDEIPRSVIRDLRFGLALGILRRQVVETFGYAAARALFTRFGFAHGWRMAEAMRSELTWDSPEEWRAAGAQIHTLQGHIHFVAGQAQGIETVHQRLTGIQILDAEGLTRTLPLEMLLVLQGLSPRLGPVAQWGLDMERKQLQVDTEKFSTSEPGIFAVGDINTYPGKKKLILCGFHEATLAAFGAMPFIAPDKKVMLQYTTTSPRLHKVLGVAPQVPDTAADK